MPDFFSTTLFRESSVLTAPLQGRIVYLPLAQICVDRCRKSEKRQNRSIRLLQSVKKYGLPRPLSVVPIEGDSSPYRYRAVDEEPLFEAACLAQLAHVPCLILEKTAAKREIEAILAQIRAKTADFFKEAAAFRLLHEEYGLTQTAIARALGLSQSAVANKLRLNRLSLGEQREILAHHLTERHARALLRIESAESRCALLRRICLEGLNVAATEELIELSLRSHAASARAEAAKLPLKVAESAEESNPPAKGERWLKTAQKPPVEGAFYPKRFVLHSLQPLYNSLERTLSIFRKTGKSAEMYANEGEDGVTITICIPRNA